MSNLSEHQKERQQQNCREYYHKKTAPQRLRNVLKDKFQNATLLTLLVLYFNPSAPAPAGFVSKYLDSWNSSMQWFAGERFEYVRITEYTDFKVGTMVFRYITNLTEAQCEKIAANWCMGKTEIKPFSQDDLDNLPQAFPVCSETLQELEKHRRWWSSSRGIRSRLICGVQ